MLAWIGEVQITAVEKTPMELHEHEMLIVRLVA